MVSYTGAMHRIANPSYLHIITATVASIAQVNTEEMSVQFFDQSEISLQKPPVTCWGTIFPFFF